MKKKTLTLIAAILTLGVAACGGGNYTPVDENHAASIADGATQHGGRTCDQYEVSVGRGWHVMAEMTSDYDNYLFLSKGSQDVATNDDANGLNARIDTDVEMAGMYTVYACAYSAGRGAYTLHITTSEGN